MPVLAERKERWRHLQEAGDHLMAPPGDYGNALGTRGPTTDSRIYIVYMGRMPRLTSSVTLAHWVIIAFTEASGADGWAEIVLFSGPFVLNGAASLTRIGFTDVSGIYNSTGQKWTTVAIDTVPIGTHIWAGAAFAVGSGLGGVGWGLLGTLRDTLQSGTNQYLSSTRPSLAATPVTTILSNEFMGPVWVRLGIP